MDNALIILHGMLWNHCIFVEHLIYVAKKCIEIKTESSQYSGLGSLLSKTFLLFKHLCNVNISLLLTFLYFEYLLIIHSKYLFTFKSNQSLKASSQNLSLSNLLYQVSQKNFWQPHGVKQIFFLNKSITLDRGKSSSSFEPFHFNFRCKNQIK